VMIAATIPYLDDQQLRNAASQASVDHVRAEFPLEREAKTLNAIYRDLLAG
jgi:hypothetical protein